MMLRITGTGLLAAAMTAAVLLAIPAEVSADEVVDEPTAASMETESVPETDKPWVEPESLETAESTDLVAELPVTSTESFGLLGVTWKREGAPDDLQIEVRTRDGGEWSAWEKLEVDDATAEGDRGGTEPMWVASANGVSVRVFSDSGRTPEDIRADLIDPGKAGADTETAAVYRPGDGTGEALQVAAAPRPTIITRSQWKPSVKNACAVKQRATMRGVTLHHTAGSNTYSKAESASIVRGIHTYHVSGRGWCDIGYNALVDKYGQIFEGRSGGIDKMISGAHAGVTAVNDAFWGISMLGHFESKYVPAKMKDAVVDLMAWKLSANGIPAKGSVSVGGKTYQRIIGHRDAKSTACPGRLAYEWISKKDVGLRDLVAAEIAKHAGGNGLSGAIASEHSRHKSQLGSPTTKVRKNSAGIYYARFKKGSIYSTDKNKTAGKTHVHWDAIENKYRNAGATTGVLGLPTGDAKKTASGLYVARFKKGSIYSLDGNKTSKKTFRIWSRIDERYRALGGTTGKLGPPTRSTYTTAGGTYRAIFKNGYIIYNPKSKNFKVG